MGHNGIMMVLPSTGYPGFPFREAGRTVWPGQPLPYGRLCGGGKGGSAVSFPRHPEKRSKTVQNDLIEDPQGGSIPLGHRPKRALIAFSGSRPPRGPFGHKADDTERRSTPSGRFLEINRKQARNPPYPRPSNCFFTPGSLSDREARGLGRRGQHTFRTASPFRLTVHRVPTEPRGIRLNGKGPTC